LQSMAQERYTEFTMVRFRPSEQEILRRAAALSDQTVSDFFRSTIVPIARRRVRSATSGAEGEGK
jgi:uncharacterized protein (DUF1778 family)